MADFAPPQGPPPTRPPAPSLPAGWTAVWDSNYNAYFYANTHTKQTQWDKPTSEARPQQSDAFTPSSGPPLDEPPPDYNHPSHGSNHRTSSPARDHKHRSNQADTSADEEYARRLQQEENARASSAASGRPFDSRGTADDYYASGPPPSNQDYSADPGGQSSKRGFLSSLLGKGKHGKQSPQPGYGYGYGYGYNGDNGPPPNSYAGSYGGPNGGPGGYANYGNSYANYAQPPPPATKKPKKHGLGTGLALGAGAGILGGMFMDHHMHDNDTIIIDERNDNYDNGFDDGFYDDGDFGGDF